MPPFFHTQVPLWFETSTSMSISLYSALHIFATQEAPWVLKTGLALKKSRFF